MSEKEKNTEEKEKKKKTKERLTLAEATKRFLEKNKPDLTISRVPSKTLETFKQLAKEEFSNDYGQLLKTILDQYLEYQSFKVLLFNLGGILERINALEDKVFGEEEKTKDIKTIKFLDGRTVAKDEE